MESNIDYAGIICVSRDLGYSKNGAIPWRCPEDLKFFKQKTMNSKLIMGRKTYESMPKNLKNREYHVLSSTIGTSLHSCSSEPQFYANTEDLLLFVDNGFVIGGDSVFHVLSTRISKFFVTYLDTQIQCDTFFTYQEVLNTQFKISNITKLQDEKHKPYIIEYDRI